jgi:hypothetical protein
MKVSEFRGLCQSQRRLLRTPGGGSLYITTNYQQNRIQTYIGLWVINLKEHPVIELDYFRALTSTCLKRRRKAMNTLHQNICLRAAICIGLDQAGSSKLRLLRWFKRLIGVIQNQIIQIDGIWTRDHERRFNRSMKYVFRCNKVIYCYMNRRVLLRIT